MRKTWVILIQALTLQAIQICDAEEQRLEFIAENSAMAVGERFLLHIQASPDSWVRVDTSSDMKSWEELVNIRVWKQATVYFDETSSSLGNRFYRLSSEGTSISDARAVWRAHEITRYRCQLEWAEGLSGGVAQVTVDGDTKTVTATNPDQVAISSGLEEDLPDMDEPFALLVDAQDSGARGIHVSYDKEFGYPTRIWIDHNPGRDVLQGFVVTEFEVLPDFN